MKTVPNILLITTDSQRTDSLRFMGSSFAHSPCLDQLASKGVVFTNAHTASPVCAPARCSLISGLHTPVHGCIENGIDRRQDITLFPALLRRAGYYTIMVGKTHFGSFESLFDIEKTVKGEKNQDSNDIYGDFKRSHGYARNDCVYTSDTEFLHIDSFLTDIACGELEKRAKKRQPFFLHCSLLSPHAPMDTPGIWKDLYNDVSLPPLNYSDRECRNQPLHLYDLLGPLDGEHTQKTHGISISREACDSEEIDKRRRLYYGLTSFCDYQVGRLVNTVERLGLRENTLIIFTTDHGQQNYDHGFNDKHNYYDESLRVPLVFSMPGTILEGKQLGFAVTTDITATILGAAGIDYLPVQGFNLMPSLVSGSPSPRLCAVSTLYRSCAVITDRFKMEYYFDYHACRLFDREKDPAEQLDVSAKPEYRETKTELLNALLTWRANLWDLQFIQSTTNAEGLGHVAKRLALKNSSMRGILPDELLGERIKELGL